MRRMNGPKIEDLLAGETPRIEWKENPEARDILDAICALANDLEDSRQPGFLILGVDKRGRAIGVLDRRGQPLSVAGSEMDELQQRLSNRALSTKLMPHPSIQISAHEIAGKTLVLLCIDPYPVPPVVKVDGVGYVRVGTTTRRATEADLVRLNERRPLSRQPFDLRPVAGARLDSLNKIELEEQYRTAMAEAGEPEAFPSLSQWLVQKNLGQEQDGHFCPNSAALLVYGMSPQDYLPGATIELVRYAGIEVDAPVALRKTITGTIPHQLDAVWAQMDALLVSRPVGDDGIRKTYLEEYPPKALNELARNLVQHRLYEGTNSPSRIEWYDDRVEFSNPGGLFGRASEGEFGSHSDYRNPTITQLLVDTGYVEHLGRGVRLVRAQLQKSGSPPIEVETNGFTRVIVRRRP